MNRHPCIKHWSELQEQTPRYYSGSQEPLSRGCALGKHFGFSRIGIHHEIVEPGHRTSWPHAEKTEDEFVHVLEGTPDVWLDGVLYLLDARFRGERVDAEELLRTHPLFEGVSAADVDSVLASITGRFFDKARLPAQPNMPTLREFQLQQGLAGMEWLRERWS